ncbi:MAG: alpha/beta hydrolase [Pseudomonadota bacterium]
MTADAALWEPSRAELLRETRVVFEVARILGPLATGRLRKTTTSDGHPVVVLPGFGADDRYTGAMRRFLRSHGHNARGWGMGKNLAGLNLPHGLDRLSDAWPVTEREHYNGEASVPYLCDRFSERVDELFEEYGEPLTLVGWSLGGYVAREAARDRPDKVRHVITLGCPIIGGPKYTATARYFRGRGMDLEWIEEVVAQRDERPIQSRVTTIYSKSDGVVAWPATIDRHSPRVNHIETNATHLGMVFNPRIWRHVHTAITDA